MPYVEGTEVVSATVTIEPYLMPKAYRVSIIWGCIETTELETQALWYDEAESEVAIRKIDHIELIQENTARFSNRSYQLATSLKRFIPALSPLRIKPTSPDDKFKSNPNEDWVPVTWEGKYNMSQIREKYSEIFQKTKRLTELQENWDSYGAAKIGKDTVAEAIVILDKIFNNRELVNLGTPYVFPVPDGSIQYEWHHGNKEIEIIIHKEPKDKISFVREFDEQIEEGTTDQSGVIEQLLWLITD